MSSQVNELKRFEGQPWSAWTEYLGCAVPPETEEETNPGGRSCSTDTCGTMRLNRSDMGIYGQYPGAEAFELAVCDFCGDKFKLAALADHIALRHADGKKVLAIDISNAALSSKSKLLQLHIQKKGKSRYNKHNKERGEKVVAVASNKLKSKLTLNDEKLKIMPDIDESSADVSTGKTDKLCKSEKTDQPTLTTLLKQDSCKLKNLKLKLRKTKETNNVSNSKLLNSKTTKTSWLNSLKSPSATLNLPIATKTKEKVRSENILKKASTTRLETAQESSPIPTKSPDNPKSSDDIAMMQPVIQLSPLDYTETSCKVPAILQDAKRRLKNDKKVVSIKDKTYNPDRHCGVVGKENTKPCTRSLTCKSHSMSLRRAVRGRSKAFDMLLADHRAEKEMFKRKHLGNGIPDPVVQASEVIVSRTNSTSNMIFNSDQKEEAGLQKFKTKSSRHTVSDYSRLSLPVSIKNPSIFSALQNQSDKLKQNYPSAVISTNAANTVRLLGASSILKKQSLNPLLSRQENVCGGVTAIHPPTFQIQPPAPHLKKSIPVKVESFQRWHHGFRRSGGLLYSNNNVPKVNGFLDSKTENSIIIEQLPQNVPVTMSPVNVSSKNHNIADTLDLSPQPDPMRIPLSFSGKKRAETTLIPKQTTNMLLPTIGIPGQSPLSSQSQKNTAVLQVAQQVQNNLIYFQSNAGTKIAASCDDALSLPSKRFKKDAKMNIVGPIISKSSLGNPVMKFSMGNGITEKDSVPISSLTGCQTMQQGISLLQNDGVRFQPTQRVHYVTSSGPLPVTLQHLPVVPQMQLKPLDVNSTSISPKFKLIAPNLCDTGRNGIFK